MPKIDDAPGLTWRKTKIGWEARWLARTDIAQRGFKPRVIRLWASTADEIEPCDFSVAFIRERCHGMQAEMLAYGKEMARPEKQFDGTLSALVDCYRTDPDSTYHKCRYNTRQFYDSLCETIIKEIGSKKVSEFSSREILRWHEQYSDRVAQGHSLIGMLRTATTFGALILENEDCQKLKLRLTMRFKAPKPRTERLTAEMVNAIRAEAHKQGRPSIALAQALQFEMTLRQKDIIGEWIPISEPGLSAITHGNSKWLRGLDWKEVDANFVVTHVTSKRQKEVTVDLKLAPMVREELPKQRSDYPASGPVVQDEKKGLPFTAPDFRRTWRAIATGAGVPRSIRNMDTRAGAISEATDAGAPLEKVRKAATHSDIGMTQRYSRGDAEATADVMRMRVESRRTKPETE